MYAHICFGWHKILIGNVGLNALYLSKLGVYL